jgi:hypothetical protein
MIAASKNTVKVTCISHTIYYFSAITFVVSGPCCFFGILCFLLNSHCSSIMIGAFQEIGCILELHEPIDVATAANVDAYMPKSGE